MNLEKINIRDPFILINEGKYYMYGTRAETCWTSATGFDCYISENLESWENKLHQKTGNALMERFM